jgi:hypothetical protein
LQTTRGVQIFVEAANLLLNGTGRVSVPPQVSTRFENNLEMSQGRSNRVMLPDAGHRASTLGEVLFQKPHDVVVCHVCTLDELASHPEREVNGGLSIEQNRVFRVPTRVQVSLEILKRPFKSRCLDRTANARILDQVFEFKHGCSFPAQQGGQAPTLCVR